MYTVPFNKGWFDIISDLHKIMLNLEYDEDMYVLYLDKSLFPFLRSDSGETGLITEWCEECHASHHSLWGIEVHYMEGARHIIRIEVKHDPGRYLGVLDKRFNFTPKTVLHLEGMETLL